MARSQELIDECTTRAMLIGDGWGYNSEYHVIWKYNNPGILQFEKTFLDPITLEVMSATTWNEIEHRWQDD